MLWLYCRDTLGNNLSGDSPGFVMVLARLNVLSVVCFVFKAREVIIACLLAVAQETIFDITKDPTLSHFSFFFFLSFFFLSFFGPLPRHMEGPRLGVQWEP